VSRFEFPINLAVGDGTVLGVSEDEVLAVEFVPFDFETDPGWTYQIYGQVVAFATYSPIYQQVLVTYVDGTASIVNNVSSFGSSYDDEAAILQLVLANP
jgi:hypothetical protein